MMFLVHKSIAGALKTREFVPPTPELGLAVSRAFSCPFICDALANPYDACKLSEPCPERSPRNYTAIGEGSHVPRPGLSGKAESETRPSQTNTGEPILTVAADPTETRLFLGSLGLGLVLHTLLPDTHQAGVGPRLAEGLVGAALDVLGERALGDLAEAGSDGLRDAERGAEALCGLAGLLVLGGVGLLGLVGLAREHDKAGLVLLQALDVGGEALLGEVLAAGIDRDADGGSIELGNAGGLSSRQNPASLDFSSRLFVPSARPA